MGRKFSTSQPTVINTELVPLDESFYLEADGQTEQWYYDNSNQYAPNRRITPLMITPKLSVYDKDNKTSYTPSIFSTSWYVNAYDMEAGAYVETLIANATDSTSADYVLVENGLLVKKNVSYSYGVTIRCVLEYIDPRDSGYTNRVQATMLLTTNRDAKVILPDVNIISPSGRTYNPLVDDDNSLYDFEGVVSNNPDIEVADVKQYQADEWGTEEIVPNGAAVKSCSPILDIRYGDETKEDQEFTFRRTNDGALETIDGYASIEKVKGNTVAWNQLLVNGNFSDSTNNWSTSDSTVSTNSDGSIHLEITANNGQITQIINTIAGHKYYINSITKNNTNTRLKLYAPNGAFNPILNIQGGTLFTNPLSEGSARTSFYYNGNAGASVDIYSAMIIDLTLIYGAGNEPTTVEQFESDYFKWFGRPLTYEPYDAGSLRSVGGTVEWNQIFKGYTLGNITKSNDVYTVTNNNTDTYIVIADEAHTPRNHVFAFITYVSLPDGASSRFGIPTSSNNSKAIVNGKNTWIFTSTSSTIVFDDVSNTATTGTSFSNCMLFDLTLIYGAGNEPSTVEEFERDYESWFGKELAYEPYDAGSTRAITTTSIKTIGFNQWDEEWEHGYLDQQTGNPTDGSGKRAKNFISVLPSTTYYFNTINSGARIFEYDANKSFLTATKVVTNSSFVTENTTRFIKFQDGWNSYNNDICINFSGARNGEYEPYEEHIANIPITTLTGKVNGSGSSVTIFPDGMKKAGSVQDEIYVENGIAYAVKRVGSVDLGTLSFSFDSGNSIFYTVSIANKAATTNYNEARYAKGQNTYDGSWSYAADKTIWLYLNNLKAIRIKDTSYSSLDSFVSAMNGVMFYYELAEPITYQIDNLTQFIFQWWGTNSNGTEADATTFPWYVGGQGTKKLTVDALYGESINVVLQCRRSDAEQLSPSKATASLQWRIPDIDTHVTCDQGSAVRSNSKIMNFSTIINLRHSVLSTAMKIKHMVMNWKSRRNTSSVETDHGWGDEKKIDGAQLYNTLGNSLSNTLVYPYIYVLGAYEEVTDNGETVTDNSTTVYDRCVE